MKPDQIIEHTLSAIDHLAMPATATYTAASVYAAFNKTVAIVNGHDVLLAIINNIPAAIGGVTLAFGCYLSDQRRRIKQRDDHEYRMARLKSGKPVEDTVDMP